MKAKILRGGYKGKVVEIGQWCNDWFMTSTGTILDTKPFSPTSLAFFPSDFAEIEKHENNGFLFNWFERKDAPKWAGGYLYTFKRKRYHE